MAHDYTRFTKRIAVKAPVSEIYKLWATQAGLESWFLRTAPFATTSKATRDSSDFAVASDSYEWTWYGWSDEAKERGTVIEANGTDRFKFTFGKAGIVTVSIKQKEGLAVCELFQENIPADEESMWNYFIGCQTGWTFYLANLKSILEGGIDLRNRDEKLTGVVNS